MTKKELIDLIILLNDDAIVKVVDSDMPLLKCLSIKNVVISHPACSDATIILII